MNFRFDVFQRVFWPLNVQSSSCSSLFYLENDEDASGPSAQLNPLNL